MNKFSVRLALVGIALLLALYPIGIEGSKTPTRTQGSDVQSTGVQAASSAVVNFQEVARQQPSNPLASEPVPKAMPEPGEFEEVNTGKGPIPADAPVNVPSPSASSPAPANNFPGMNDIAMMTPPGTPFFVIPPDTMGAVGTDAVNKVFCTLNNNFRIQDKTTGSVIGSDVSMPNFWAPTGAGNPFDPRVQYDPYNNRWILAAVSDAGSANTSILVGISVTSDPSGVYTLFRFSARIGSDASSVNVADFPMLGFNKNWVVVSINMFTSAGFFQGRVLALDYPTLRTGAASGTYFTGSSIGFCMHPVTTYSAAEPNEYLVQHLTSALATYDLSTLSGTPAAPTLTVGAVKSRPGGAWVQPGGNILPQATGTCTSAPTRIDVGDAQVRSNAVFRNGTVWYPQTVGLPAGGPLTHTAIQWTQLDTAPGNFGNVLQGGRIEDPTATSTNGGKWYAYSSIAVNAANDALLAFSQFSSSQFASAGYTYHDHTDGAGTMRGPVIYKAGEDCYSKDFGTGRNRWGDYSHTMVDPTNDFTLWTIQEYAKLQASPTVGGSTSKWGTWWAELVCTLTSCPADQTVVSSASCPISSEGAAITFSTPTSIGPCGDVTCSPASGTVFPVGSTTVTCSTPAGPSCSFKVNSFSFCLQDETNPGNYVLISPNTGDYIFFCNGVQIASGTGVLNAKGCIGSIQHNKGDRRIQINWDTSAEGVGAGTAIIQLGPNNTKCQIIDKNMSNNTCTAPPVVTSPRGKPDKGRSQN